MNAETLIPKLGVVTDIRIDTPDVKTFRVVGLDGKKVFEHMPGQCAMLSIPGVGEAMFSITSSPTNTEFMEFSIKKCGVLTDYLHSLEVGDDVMENIPSLIPGAQSIAHCPGICSNSFPPSGALTRNVFTSGVSSLISVITPTFGIRVSRV